MFDTTPPESRPCTPAPESSAPEDSQVRVADPERTRAISATACVARFCPVYRDIYLERHAKIRPATWPRSVLGKIVDKLMCEVYRIGVNAVDDEFERALQEDSPVDLSRLGSMVKAESEALVAELFEGWKCEHGTKVEKAMSLEQFADTVSGESGKAGYDRLCAASRRSHARGDEVP